MQSENKQLYKLLNFISIAVGQNDKYCSKILEYEHQKYLLENFEKSAITTVENLKNKAQKFKIKLEKTRKSIQEIYSEELNSYSLKWYYDLFNEYEKTKNNITILVQEINRNSDIFKHDTTCNKEEVSKNLRFLEKKHQELSKFFFKVEKNLLNEIYSKMEEIENEQL